MAEQPEAKRNFLRPRLTCGLIFLALAGSLYVLLDNVFFRHDRYIDGRIQAFAAYSYNDWEALHSACQKLAKLREKAVFRPGDSEWERLPEAIRASDPRFVEVIHGDVLLRYSGGHFRFVHIEFRGGEHPPDLYAAIEGLFGGDTVFPSEDRRPLGNRGGWEYD